MTYTPTYESVHTHPVPDWFHNAKLGIFIHWGLYSVPGWAQVGTDLGQVLQSGGWKEWFKNNAYAEWYMNTYQIEGSTAQQHHQKTYGKAFDYKDFAPMFNKAAEKWNPDAWADLFKKVNARYVVLTTKHHDGFLLWNSRHKNPFVQNYHSERDLPGELTEAVRKRGMTMALYYSGGLDWTFNPKVIQDIADIPAGVPQMKDYVDYANSHWLELIERYQPAILWNDIAYPANTNLNELFAHYYNKIPEGLVNNRFAQKFEIKDGHQVSDNHFDFETPEYSSFSDIKENKWESCRGIGTSFGYNQAEGPESYLSVQGLIHSFVDIVSKNGNLLLNIGPMADGTIPALQLERLEALGSWLDLNGEAIFDTRPWQRAEGKTSDGLDVRFTCKSHMMYAIVLGQAKTTVRLEGFKAMPSTTVHLLGHDVPLQWQQRDKGVEINLPTNLREAVAQSFRITPELEWVL
jgi:alpha-L-fucosidase